MKALVFAGSLCLVMVWQLPASATDLDTAGIAKMFARAKDALQTKHEKRFAAQFHPAGYKQNLVGSSGLPGRAVFRQGARKGWYLRPQMKSLQSFGRGQPPVVTCLIWSTRKKRAVDKIHAVVIWHKKRWVILGGGEKLRQVKALAHRYAKKLPLAPPPRRKR